ncbi:RusA family crossover junction endodeoxyribonuclease [uncultured Deinococcus sp.]|uniref:RusA family crossover junction endodeoxyribonuclease n=1 Tax=uncultured Deinococcus sp. TaxID=158789 RepID=UPI0025F2C8BA|nr:RusA family crossover junction endodeoxyribonuclease [uncultured Deinococcus sp.]
MNPFPTRQAAEAYLARIPDLSVRDATRARLGLDEVAAPAPEPRPLPEPRQHAVPAPSGRVPVTVSQPVTASTPGVLTFTLPFPPSLNSIWRATLVPCKPKKPGAPPWAARVLLSQEGRQYRRAVRDIIRALHNPSTPPGARLALHLHVCPPDRRARDLSNLPKALEDALTHAGVWADDSLIDELRVTRGPVTTGGQVHVTIRSLTATLFEVQS